MNPSLSLSFLGTRLRRQWWLHGVLIASMALLPCPRVDGDWTYEEQDGVQVFGWRNAANTQFTSLDSMGPSNDADGDNLSNQAESDEGSDPYEFDTDLDGLADGLEAGIARNAVSAAFSYSLSVTNWDSDGDFISDHDDYYKALSYSFADIQYPSGQLPGLPGSTYSDYDGDGVKNHIDPVHDNPLNPSPYNATDWPGTTALGDNDSDGTLNWWDESANSPPDNDVDDDGIDDIDDPVVNDANNPSTVNGHNWPGTSAIGDLDGDTVINWEDSDSDGDGLDDWYNGAYYDPVHEDASNPSSVNGHDWPGTAAMDNLDGDSDLNWWDADSDGDGIEDNPATGPADPVHDNADNPSSENGQNWPGLTAIGDNDGDSELNWWDASPDPVTPSDSDGDGLNDDVDPVVGDANNPSATNYRDWPGTTANADNDSDNVTNWADDDSDGDGLSDAATGSGPGNFIPYDPVPDNTNNPSPHNGQDWPGASALGDNDNDGTLNWWELDSDRDGIFDADDPVPSDSSNPSPHNNTTWSGTSVFGDMDNDTTLNWWDEDPDGDNLHGTTDPVPASYDNWSQHNQTNWPGDTAVGDNDSDNTLNWWDASPNDPPPPIDTDLDGLYDDEEPNYGTDINLEDTDGDGLTDYEEVRGGFGSSPTNKWSLSQGLGWGDLYTDWQLADLSDTDPKPSGPPGDGIPDRIEAIYGLNSSDPADAYGDLDGDGVSNLIRYSQGIALNANLIRYDADLDGMLDAFEDYYGLDANNPADATHDQDGDGVNNFEEQKIAASPDLPDTFFTSLGDHIVLATKLLYPAGGAPVDDTTPANGLPDWYDAALTGADPVLTAAISGDIDGDLMPDAWEHWHGLWRNADIGLNLRFDDAADDNDSDGITNLTEWHLSLNPLLPNSDGSGAGDGDEDWDGDGISNRDEELIHHTKAWLRDSDGDGIDDGIEIAEGTDPNSFSSNRLVLVGLRIFTPFPQPPASIE